jgi:hypothetical protein
MLPISFGAGIPAEDNWQYVNSLLDFGQQRAHRVLMPPIRAIRLIRGFFRP